MRVSPLRCWALFAATAAAGALAQAVPPSKTFPNAVPPAASKPNFVGPPASPNAVAAPGKLPDGTPLPGKLPDGTALDGKLPPPPERPPGWLPKTTPQEGPELNSVPPSLAEGGVMRREPHVVETTPTLDAVGTANEVMSVAGKAGELADAVSGGHYEKPLEKFGKVLGGVDLAIKLGGGIYRDGGTGLARATEELWEEAKTTAVIEFGAGVAAGMAGHAAAPVAAAATAGWGIGSAIDSVAGDAIFRNGVGMVQD
ncbi:MAG: hypothetical protein ABI669_11125, partial [Usitatibacter sp.]